MTDLNKLSEPELLTLIKNAEEHLKTKQAERHKEVIAKIKELAASIGIEIVINKPAHGSADKATKLPIKYRNPKDSKMTWTGRGLKPKWVSELLDQGAQLEDLLV